MTQQDTQPPAETLARQELEALANLIERPPHDDVLLKQDVALRSATAIRVVLAALTRRAGGDAIPAGEAEAFRRGAEAMQRKLADALRDHLNSRAAAIANAVAIPEYQA